MYEHETMFRLPGQGRGEPAAPDPRRSERYIEHSLRRADPGMSRAREKVIAKLIRDGRARSAEHAQFLAQAGVVSLPN